MRYTVRIKTAHFNNVLALEYSAEKNKVVDLFTTDGAYLGLYRNGKKLKNLLSKDSVKMIVNL